MARPSSYTEALGLKICSEIAHGKSLVSICKADDMPSVVSVYSWLNDERYKAFLNSYTRAREDQADTLADEIVSIADDATHDTTTNPETGYECANTEWLARSRLRVDARKWVAAKLKPKKYGDKLDVEAKHTGNVILTLSNVDAEL
jgi:hypothetical protein